MHHVQQFLTGQTLARILQGLGRGFQFPNGFLQLTTKLRLFEQLFLQVDQRPRDRFLPAACRALGKAAEQGKELLIEQVDVLLDDLTAHIARAGLQEPLDQLRHGPAVP